MEELFFGVPQYKIVTSVLSDLRQIVNRLLLLYNLDIIEGDRKF